MNIENVLSSKVKEAVKAIYAVDLPSVDLPSVDLPSMGMPQFAGGGGGMFESFVPPEYFYRTPEYRQIQLPKQVDYVAELNNIIARNSGRMA